MKSLRPVLDLIRLAVLDFKLATVNPMAPFLNELLDERARILSRRSSSLAQ